jgi:Zn-finger nucleic acid-binding protein
MKCPVCDVDLLLSERQGVEIDYCPKCRGIWLDRGELDKIVEKYNKDDENRDADKRLKYDDSVKYQDSKSDEHYHKNEKVYYDKYGRPIKKKGGFFDVFGDIFD